MYTIKFTTENVNNNVIYPYKYTKYNSHVVSTPESDFQE